VSLGALKGAPQIKCIIIIINIVDFRRIVVQL